MKATPRRNMSKVSETEFDDTQSGRKTRKKIGVYLPPFFLLAIAVKGILACRCSTLYWRTSLFFLLYRFFSPLSSNSTRMVFQAEPRYISSPVFTFTNIRFSGLGLMIGMSPENSAIFRTLNGFAPSQVHLTA